MVTTEGLTKAALAAGVVVILIIGVNASLGTAQILTGKAPSSSVLPGILGSGNAATAGTAVWVTAAAHTLATDGRGSVTLSPDEAQITVGVQTQASTAQAASTQNAAAIGQVITKLNSIGIANSSISTSTFYITAVYDYKSNPATITGYQATHSLLVTLQSADLSALGPKVSQVIDTSVGAGANQVSQVYFTLSDSLMKTTNNQALQLALQDASARAQLMASTLGIKLSGVDTVTSTTSSPPRAYTTASQAPNAGGGVASTSILPGNFTVTASVQVSYDIQ